MGLWGLTARSILHAQYTHKQLSKERMGISTAEIPVSPPPQPFLQPGRRGGKNSFLKEQKSRRHKQSSHWQGHTVPVSVPQVSQRLGCGDSRGRALTAAPTQENPGELRLLCTPSSKNANENSELLTRARHKKRLAAETVNKHRRQRLYRITGNGFIPAKSGKVPNSAKHKTSRGDVAFPPWGILLRIFSSWFEHSIYYGDKPGKSWRCWNECCVGKNI